MATLTDLINDPTIPAHLREQIAQSQIETAQQGAELVSPSEGDLSELIGGKMKVTHQHQAGTGKMLIYDSDTGEPREILQYMAAKTLMKQRNGKPAFTLTPTKVYRLGDVMCYLHPDHPDRGRLREMGLDATKDCGYGGDRPPAAHLASEYDRDLHMEHRHGREWKVITSALEEQRRQEQVDMQREQIEAMRSMAGAAMKGPATEATATVQAYYCQDCPRFFDTEQGLKVHEGRDHKGA